MKTKIIATIGPASDKYPILKEMVASGMDIIRFNTKYGSTDEFIEVTNAIRKIDGIKIMYDIKGDHLIDWIVKQDFDYLAVSFAKNKEDIQKYRKIIPPHIKIIAKILS